MAYDIVQTAWLLGIAANGASSIQVPSSVTDGQSFLEQNLSLYMKGNMDQEGGTFAGVLATLNTQVANGPWSIVWGPHVYLAPNCDEATNAMYVAKYTDTSVTPNTSTYVVAVAATNPASIYDWLNEDARVEPNLTVPWPLPDNYIYAEISHLPLAADVPFISGATALGISNLLNYTGPKDNNIQTFLKSVANTNDTLIFAGHSLAGALTPTLAFHLYPTGTEKSGWGQVLVLPTAGATPGNGAPGLIVKNPQAFSELFAQNFPPTSTGLTPYTTWNTDYANQDDVVPHAWNQLSGFRPTQNPSPNQDTYTNPWGVMTAAVGLKLGALLDTAQTISFGGYYQNINQIIFQPTGQYYAWTLNSTTNQYEYPPTATDVTAFTVSNPLTTSADLGNALLWSHVQAYFFFFGVLPPVRMPPGGLVPVPLDESQAPAQTQAGRKDLLRLAAQLSP